jgi:FkbM family methyltransferase
MDRKIASAAILLACALIAWNTRDVAGFVWRKATGATACPWSALARDNGPKREQVLEFVKAVRHIGQDGKLGLYQTPGRTFWNTSTRYGEPVLAAALLETDWTASGSPEEMPHSGDVVLDCGADFGPFTDLAFRRGAAKVVAIEPDPDKVECLRRNFPNELRQGRILVVPAAAWDSRGTARFAPGNTSTRGKTSVYQAGRKFIDSPVDTIDDIVAGLNLQTVNYIRLGIEGAERKALSGARQVLARYRPRLMAPNGRQWRDCSDMPDFVPRGVPAYHMTCGPCIKEEAGWMPAIVPSAVYFK